jgi:hypothetical protein
LGWKISFAAASPVARIAHLTDIGRSSPENALLVTNFPDSYNPAIDLSRGTFSARRSFLMAFSGLSYRACGFEISSSRSV